MADTPTASQTTVLAVYQLLNGAAPGHEAFVNQSGYFDQFGEAAYAAMVTLALQGRSNQLVATSMARGAGIVNAGVVDYIAAVLGSFDAAARGQVVVNLGNKLATLEGDSNFGAQAVQFNQKTLVNFVYASDPAHGPESLPGGSSQPAGTRIFLAPGQDVVAGSGGLDDFISAVGTQPDVPPGPTTLDATDVIDGLGGIDNLLVVLGASYAGGATVRNIEILRLASVAAGTVAFDYNAVPSVRELSGVTTIAIERLVSGQAISVLNVVGEAVGAGAAATVRLPTVALSSAVGTAQWGSANIDYRPEAVAGVSQTQPITLENINSGTLNLGPGIETVQLTGIGDQRSTLAYSARSDTAGPHDAAADIVSAGALTRVAVAGLVEIGKRAGIQVRSGLTDRLAGTDGGLDGSSLALGDSTASNLLSVESRVSTVDASALGASGQVDLRFVARTDGVGTDVSFTGGLGGSYVEFALGNVAARGGAAGDTFAFIQSDTTTPNATFGSGDTLSGGAGADTLQLGVNGIGSFDLAASAFANTTGIETLDLRGAVNRVAMSAALVASVDAGATLTLRTDRIVQTTATDASNAAGASTAEDNAVSTVDLTGMAPGQRLVFLGGSGADHVVVTDATATVALRLDGGSRAADATGNSIDTVPGFAGYDTLTLQGGGMLDGADLSNVQGFEALLLARDTDRATTFGIELTAAFLLANTAATNRAATVIDDTVFHIGAAVRNGSAALGTGDAVVLDISNLLDAGRTSLAASLAGRGIDVHVGSAQVRYLVDGAAATAAQVALVSKADAAMAVQSVELVGLDGGTPVLG